MLVRVIADHVVEKRGMNILHSHAHVMHLLHDT